MCVKACVSQHRIYETDRIAAIVLSYDELSHRLLQYHNVFKQREACRNAIQSATVAIAVLLLYIQTSQ